MDSNRPAEGLTDSQLIGEVKRLTRCESQATAALIASLAEFDARRLYLGEGCASLFAYCTQVLHLSEHAAYHRIEACRAGRRFPLVLDRLRTGDVTLTAIGLLGPHLTAENHRALLDEARHRSKREVEEIVARLRPRPDVAASVRKLPTPRQHEEALTSSATAAVGTNSAVARSMDRADDRATAATSESASLGLALSGGALSAPSRPALVRPLAPARYQLQVTISLETRDKLRQAQDLLRHVLPNGDTAVILDRALTLLVGTLERARQKKTRRQVAPVAKTRETPVKRKAAGETSRTFEAGGRGRVPSDAGGAAASSGQSSVETLPVSPTSKTALAMEQATPTRRHVPAAVVRQVWERDGAQCAFVGAEGRCRERSFLELHHRQPFAEGGPCTLENLELRCRSHNAFEAVRHFGTEKIAEARKRRREGSPAAPVGSRSGPS